MLLLCSGKKAIETITNLGDYSKKFICPQPDDEMSIFTFWKHKNKLFFIFVEEETPYTKDINLYVVQSLIKEKNNIIKNWDTKFSGYKKYPYWVDFNNYLDKEFVSKDIIFNTPRMLEEIKLPEKTTKDNLNNVVANQKLSEDFIIDNIDKIENRELILRHQPLSEKFIKKYILNSDLFDGCHKRYVTSNQSLSEKFILTHSNFLSFKYLPYNQNLTLPILTKYKDNLNWGVVCKYQNLSEYILNTFFDYLDFKALRKNKRIPQNIILKMIGKHEQEKGEKLMPTTKPKAPFPEFGKMCKENKKESIGDEILEKMKLKDGRFGLTDDNVSTKLLDKSFSPMIIRKYTRLGFPIFVHMICDHNLNDLDNIVHDCLDYCKENNILENDIQSLRNLTGIMGEWINTYYDRKKRGCVESLGVLFYCDKMIISSLQGDSMNHLSCRQELYASLQLMTQM